jgi:hypothetical protein
MNPAPLPGPTAENLHAFLKHRQQIYVGCFDDIVELERASPVQPGTRFYHDISGGPGNKGIFEADVAIYRACGNEVTCTVYTCRAYDTSQVGLNAMLASLGSTLARSNYSDYDLLSRLRALNAGMPQGFDRILAVKDEGLSDFYYVSDRERVLAWYKDRASSTPSPAGKRMLVLHDYQGNYEGSTSYDPSSAMAPFIEAELAKLGIVIKR